MNSLQRTVVIIALALIVITGVWSLLSNGETHESNSNTGSTSNTESATDEDGNVYQTGQYSLTYPQSWRMSVDEAGQRIFQSGSCRLLVHEGGLLGRQTTYTPAENTTVMVSGMLVVARQWMNDGEISYFNLEPKVSDALTLGVEGYVDPTQSTCRATLISIVESLHP